MRTEGQREVVSIDELPCGWTQATIGETIGFDGLFIDGDWVESKDQDPNGDVRLIQLADVGDGVYHSRSNRFLTHEKAVQLGCSFLQASDMLIARMPDPLGRACIFPGDTKPSITAVDVCIVRTGANGLDHKWLMYTINSPAFRTVIASLQSGSTRKRISRSNLAKIEFPLPPLPEQHRIVTKIEELFTRLDAGVDALNKMKLQLKRYRQSVLKSAFEGKLTAQWREAHKGELEPASVLLEKIKEERAKTGKSKKLPPLDTSDLPELPSGWEWVSTSQLSTKVTDGTHKTPEYVAEGIPFISVNNMSQEGTLDFSSSKYITSDEHRELYKKCNPEFGDVLLSKVGTIGLTAVVPTQKEFSLFVNTALIKPVREHISPVFLAYALRNGFLSQIYASYISGSTQKFIGTSNIGKLPIPLSSVQEQYRIVEEIDRHLSVAEKIDKTMEQALKQSDRFRQSILKRAFEGKLVPQDPNDEPAEKLLERIKADKARQQASGMATRGRNMRSLAQGRLA